MKRNSSSRCSAAATLWLLGATGHVAAQQSPPQVVDEGLRRQAERDRVQQDALDPKADMLRTAPPSVQRPTLPGEQPCFQLAGIALQGPDAAAFGWLDRLAQAFVGQCAGARGVAAITAYLDAQLVDRGYVTSRISVGPQNLAAGRLTLHLQAGRIAEVSMVRPGGKQPDEAWGTWTNAFPTHAGRLLDIRDLEQGVEQMKRLPSQRVATLIEPGSEPDTSVLWITREPVSWRDRVRGSVTLDNSGSPTLGKPQGTASVSLDNPLGLSDILSLGVNSNLEAPNDSHRSAGYTYNDSLPFGYSTFSLSGGRSRFAQTVALTTTRVLTSGDSNNAELRWEHIAWRTASTKAGLDASVSVRSSHSYLDDVELAVQRRRTTFAHLGLSFEKVFAGGGSLALQAGRKVGTSWLAAQANLEDDPEAPGTTPTLRPRLWLFDASANVPLQMAVFSATERPWRYSSSLRGQLTHDRTLSIDQFSIGNRYSVRGFDGDVVLLAENGYVWRNELSTPVRLPAGDGAVYLGLDTGRVWGRSDQALLGRQLAGGAVGVRGGWKALQYDVALAAPLYKPQGFATSRASAYLSATYGF